jgi:flagellar hook-associated protein FlgK
MRHFRSWRNQLDRIELKLDLVLTKETKLMAQQEDILKAVKDVLEAETAEDSSLAATLTDIQEAIAKLQAQPGDNPALAEVAMQLEGVATGLAAHKASLDAAKASIDAALAPPTLASTS